MGFDAQVGYEHVILLGGGFVLVDVGGHAALHFEEVVSVAVDLVGGGGGKTHDECVEVVEDGLVFLEDGAVRLIHDDQVEVGGRVHAHAVVVSHGVDGVEDSGVGGEHDARVAFIFVLA